MLDGDRGQDGQGIGGSMTGPMSDGSQNVAAQTPEGYSTKVAQQIMEAYRDFVRYGFKTGRIGLVFQDGNLVDTELSNKRKPQHGS